MLVLGINTVGDACDVALVADGAIVAELSEPMQQGHDARLAPIVGRLMRESRTAFSSLDRIAVIVGPGSFTGVRVGVAFARGLALSLDKPAVGVSSLQALDALPRKGVLMGLLPAKRRPPERTWWAQLIDDGHARAAPYEASEQDVAAYKTGPRGFDALCGGLEGVPDHGIPRIAAKPSARAAALYVAALTGALPPARPIYVREPDAKPMRAP